MGLIQLLLILVVIGFALWLVLRYIPLGPPFREVIIFVAVVGTVVLLLQAFGFIHTGLHL
jgi:hypothetical protein